MRLEWRFDTQKTLEDRFNYATSTGEPVTWTVSRPGNSSHPVIRGTWWWSDSSGGWPSYTSGECAMWGVEPNSRCPLQM